MDREPRKRRQSWFTKPHPNTPGQTWQQRPQPKQESEAWLTREGPEPPAQEEVSRQPRWQPLPPLPKWPPLPEESSLAQVQARAAAPFSSEEAPTAEQSAVAWDLPAREWYDRLEQPQRTLWLRFRSTSRQRQVSIVAGIVCAFVLCSLLGAAALSGAFHSDASHIGATGGGTRLTGNETALPATALATPGSASSTPSPAAPTTTPVPPFTIAFTCASGAVGGTGEVCVHTRPNAILTISVQYCDGSIAGGKSLQGIAHADGSGDYTWRWGVTTSCVGTATATVTAKSTGQSASQSTTFTITG